jgi:large conductance mechanosensitive channel
MPGRVGTSGVRRYRRRTMSDVLGEFKRFLLKGNLIDLAVAFVMGLAFAAVVATFVDSLINPLIGLILGKRDLGDVAFTIRDARFAVGEFLNALITFVSTAAAVFFFVVRPYQAIQARRARGEAPEEATISDDERRHQELLAAVRELRT